MASRDSPINAPTRVGEPLSRVPTRTYAKKPLLHLPQTVVPPVPVPRSRDGRPRAKTVVGREDKSSVATLEDSRPRTAGSRIAAPPPRSPSVMVPTTNPPQKLETAPLRSPHRLVMPARGKAEVVVVGESRQDSHDRMPRAILRRKPSNINEYTRGTSAQQFHPPIAQPPGSSQAADRVAAVTPPERHRTPGLEPLTIPWHESLGQEPLSFSSRPDQDHPDPVINNATGELPKTYPYDGLPHDVRLPTPLYSAQSDSSPSTRHSESPSLWSRTSTPTSMSSHSPGTAIPARWAPRPRQASPNYSRPPVTWKGAKSRTVDDVSGRFDAQGLPALRESLTSSSSGSTIKAGERNELIEKDAGQRKKKKRLSPPPPSPPIRKSSMKPIREALPRKPEPNKPSYALHLPPTLQPPINIPSSSKEASVVAVSRDLPPPRPSRDGAPSLNGLNEPSVPVIHSNLTGLPFSSHRRRGSTEAFNTGLPASKGTAKLSSRRGRKGSESGPEDHSASPDCSQAHRGPTLLRALSPAPTALPPTDAKLRKRGQSPAQGSPSRGLPRFGFFSRRPRAETEEISSEKSNKSIKKGPAAGTGHEGYGRYVLRGRSGSASSASGSWPRSPSESTSGSGARSVASRKDSTTSKDEPELDEFFLDRLDPVVIVGGNGSVDSHTSAAAEVMQAGASQSSFEGRPSVDSQGSGSTEFSSFSRSVSDISREGPEASNEPTEARFHPLPQQAPGSGTSREQVPALTTYPSRQGSPMLMGKGSHRDLPPINTNPYVLAGPLAQPPTKSSSITPSTTYSDLPLEDISEGREGNWLKSRSAGTHAASLRKWNFPPRPLASSEPANVREVQVQVARHHPVRSLAHYALLDPVEQEGPEDLSAMMQEVDQFNDSDVEEAGSPLREAKTHVHSVLLPDPPVFPLDFQNPRAISPKVMLRTRDASSPPAEPARETPSSKPSRLPQVGRIPRVVSSRVRKPPAQSFSRPFSSVRPHIALAALSQAKEDHKAKALQVAPADQAPAQPVVASAPNLLDRVDEAPSQCGITATGYDNLLQGKEFLSFPPRKDSEVSCPSTSGIEGYPANAASYLPSSAGPGEDEVWKEYDDLLDHVFSPDSGMDSRSSYGFPSTLDTLMDRALMESSPVGGFPHSRLPSARTDSRLETTPSPDVSAALSTRADGSRTLDPAMPGTPVSFTDLFAGYGERNLSGAVPTNTRVQKSPTKRTSLTSDLSGSAAGDGGREVPGKTDLENPSRRQRNGLEPELNLRFGALMTSRWLSFGRVLFSPAHDEIKKAAGGNRQDRLLILDGLGNDDWSFYCALTYPHATVYNLSPSPRLSSSSTRKRESGALQSPPNHRQIHQASFANPFPFPKGFFAVVVFRFPVTSSDAAYRNAISECKRVLRPGGYLETSILDLDLMNMGDRARRAVRLLKVRMQQSDSNVSLKPASDNIQRLLGRRGFENVYRCMLGVPAAGNVTRSREASVDETSLSLSELLKDQSQEGDVGITKTVARVGRWWYTRCHEMGTLPEGDLSRSIWNDRALLRECEKLQTSFKLLICYAQKPLTPRRRTVSV